MPHDEARITSIYVFSNGMVAVCDQYGRQMTEYQGAEDEVRERLIRDAPPDTRCYGITLPDWIQK